MEIFLTVLSLAGTFSTLLGTFVLVVVFILPKKSPMDSSNRINHLRLTWFVLSQPHTFAELYEKRGDNYRLAFPELRNDEGGNVDGII